MPENGFLTVRTYTSDAQLPVRGVAITVTQPTQNGTRLIAARLTDENGKIEPITIPAPARPESQEPGALKPFVSIDIIADHPEYERILVENVQVFAGVLTQQNLEMIPIGARPEAWNVTEVFNITAQPL